MLTQQSPLVLEDLQCDFLPYGAVGFISHLILFYSTLCIWFGVVPLKPWCKLDSYILANCWSFILFPTSIAFGIANIVRCRNHWPLILLSLERMGVLIWTCAVMSVFASHIQMGSQSGSSGNGNTQTRMNVRLVVAAMLLVYIPFAVIGYAGITVLAIQNWDRVSTFTIYYSGFFLATCLACCSSLTGRIYLGRYPSEDNLLKAVYLTPLMIVFLIACYEDWVLGIIVENMWGAPYSAQLTWFSIYFVLEKLPLFTF